MKPLLKKKKPGLGYKAPVSADSPGNLVHRFPLSAESTKPIVDRLKPVLYFLYPIAGPLSNSSGGKRTLRILEILSANFEVYLILESATELDNIDKSRLEKWGINIYLNPQQDKLINLLPSPTVIIYSYYYTYYQFLPLIKANQNALLIADTVDLHWLREERGIPYLNGLTPGKVAGNKEKEKQSYHAADKIWAVTEVDRSKILAEIPNAKIDIVSNIHVLCSQPYYDNQSNNLFFIGSFLHRPNITAVLYIAQTIFPQVKASIPNVQFFLAGSNMPDEVKALDKIEGITIYENLSDEALDNLYAQVFIVVAPLLFGAGIKGKITEAITKLKPVITNKIGNEGINLQHEKEGLIVENDQMASIVCKALKREYDFESMTANAQKKIEGLIGLDAVRKNILSSLFPPISICIVTFNRLALLKRCINAIFEHTRYPNYRVLVYSNGCTDDTKAYLEHLAAEDARVFPFFGQQNEVFVRPSNKLMEKFPDDEVVLLNNDVVITPNWLSNLYNIAAANPEVGIVGPKILYPDSRLQEFGSIIYNDGSGENIGKNQQANKKEYTAPARVGYVSGCAMYIKRTTIRKIGYLDDQFHPCYYEDSDYCYTARKHGIETIVTPHSVVFHDEGATAGKNPLSGMKRFQVINKEKFLLKHRQK